MFSVTFQEVNFSDEEEDEYIKKMIDAAKFYLPDMTKDEMKKIYDEEIEPEFRRMLVELQHYKISKDKKSMISK